MTALTSTMSAGAPSPSKVAPPKNGSAPRTDSNCFTTISSCPTASAIATPAPRQLSLRELRRRRVDEPVRLGTLQHAVAVDTLAVIAHPNLHGRAVAGRTQHETTGRPFAGGDARSRSLDPVVHRVAQEVHERL